MRHPSSKNPDVKTLKPGMTVYLLPTEAKDKLRVKEAEIVKIGRKYVSVKERYSGGFFPLLYQFDFTDRYLEKPGVYGRSFDLFFSMEEIDDFFLHRELMAKINTKTNYAYYLTTHQLKQICDLLDKGQRIYKGLEFNNREV